MTLSLRSFPSNAFPAKFLLQFCCDAFPAKLVQQGFRYDTKALNFN